MQASLGGDLLLPGGKVDPEAIRRAIDEARQRATESGEDSADEALPRVLFTLQRDLQTRLDKYLTSRITFMSRTQLQRLIGSGGVTVNERVAKASTKLSVGDRVEVVVPPPPDKAIRAQEIPLEVLFEDEHLIVLNKQADIIVHPARSELSGTMINALAWHFRHVSGGALWVWARSSHAPGWYTGSTGTRPGASSSPRTTRRTGSWAASSRSGRWTSGTWRWSRAGSSPTAR